MIITQSLTKDIEQLCPRLVQDIWVDGNRTPPNEAMLNGSYFEQKCLGSGATGEVVDDLPRLKAGGKSAEHQRIDQQVENFKSMFDPSHRDYMGWTIKDKQLKITLDDREGTLDFTMTKEDRLAVVDLKLTGDLQGGYWSSPDEVDMIQGVHYQYLYTEKFDVVPDFYYLIFDYSTKMNIKLIKVIIGEDAIQDYHRRFNDAKHNYLEWFLLKEMDGEFPRQPHPLSCSRCRLACDVRSLKQKVQYQEIYL